VRSNLCAQNRGSRINDRCGMFKVSRLTLAEFLEQKKTAGLKIEGSAVSFERCLNGSLELASWPSWCIVADSNRTNALVDELLHSAAFVGFSRIDIAC
jgi:hypothetical protein